MRKAGRRPVPEGDEREGANLENADPGASRGDARTCVLPCMFRRRPSPAAKSDTAEAKVAPAVSSTLGPSRLRADD